jgi:hypothetical protein
MADSDALEPSIILISMVWLQNSNTVHVASVEVAAQYTFPAWFCVFTVQVLQCVTTRYEVGPLYTALIVTMVCVLPPVVAAITHQGGSRVMMNPVGKDARQDREHSTLDGLGVGGSGSLTRSVNVIVKSTCSMAVRMHVYMTLRNTAVKFLSSTCSSMSLYTSSTRDPAI